MTPPILSHAGPLLDRYDVLFCDVWGVVHDGLKAYVAACEALERFRAKGGIVVLVSNAPVPKEQVARMLASRAVPQAAWDTIVSSGDIALAHIAERGYGALHCIGPRDRDSALFAKLTARQTSMADAEAILCSGLVDDRVETAESYRHLLAEAADRKLPFVCANPDLHVDVGGKLYLCAGALADLYQTMEGPVYWAGKPHPIAYQTAHSVAQQKTGRPIETARILAVGDAVRTDLKAAQGAGVDALFIAGGIHRGEVMENGAIQPALLKDLLQIEEVPAIAAMTHLSW